MDLGITYLINLNLRLFFSELLIIDNLAFFYQSNLLLKYKFKIILSAFYAFRLVIQLYLNIPLIISNHYANKKLSKQFSEAIILLKLELNLNYGLQYAIRMLKCEF